MSSVLFITGVGVREQKTEQSRGSGGGQGGQSCVVIEMEQVLLLQVDVSHSGQLHTSRAHGSTQSVEPVVGRTLKRYTVLVARHCLCL